MRSHRVSGSPSLVAAEIDDLDLTIGRYRAGLVPEHVFLEKRLRHGIYGQRQDGVNMLRSKLPLGILGAAQLDAFADVAERYGHGVAHLTTRQDIQVHFVTLDRTPELLRVLDAADMTSREACGNVVRNVTASANAGVAPDEPFDVTPWALAFSRHLLRHPDGQALGRKFKATFAGVDDPAWNLGRIHDLGATARVVDGRPGFHVRVGGGLGAIPHEAKVLAEFVPAEELLPLAQAILRVFAIHGEKHNRARARLKFLVADWGIERFREEVAKERAGLEPEPGWEIEPFEEPPLRGPSIVFPVAHDAWLRTNVLRQRQPGYAAVRIRVPRGDLSPAQLRGLATLLREETGDTLRITPEQGLLLRWVPWDRLNAVRGHLDELDLGQARAQGLGDTVTCPGADTCKLGITSPRAVARAMEPLLDRLAREPRLEKLRVHVSGCPNACAQHSVADLGFFGAARTVNGVASPHYLLVLGGEAGGGSFGTSITKVPAARVGDAIERLTGLFLAESTGESFGAFARRVGRERIKALLDDLQEIPSYDEAPSFYREPGSTEPFRVVRGVGECAGEVVDIADFLLADADREIDAASATGTAAPARRALLLAARALLANDHVNPRDDADVVAQFKARYYDTGRIYEGVGYYFLAGAREGEVSGDRLTRLVAEAGLFVEEAHGMLTKLRAPAPKPRTQVEVEP